MIREALDAVPAGPIPVDQHVRRRRARSARRAARAIRRRRRRSCDGWWSLIPSLRTRSERARGRCQPSVEVVTGDASRTTSYAGAVPADIVLVCGIFGNITDDDIHNTVAQLPSLCAPDATVIWTRGTFAPDLTPTIRGWFTEAGFSELDFVAIPGTTVGVGATRLTSPPRAFEPDVRLFTFLPRAERPSRQGGC